MESFIYLIRHGITEGLEKNLFYGWLDLPVTEGGFKELEKFKKEGIYPSFNEKDVNYYISGLTRTKQTLNAIFGDVNYRIIPNLKEINFGDWEGADFENLQNQVKWKEWMENPGADFRFPNGECQSEFRDRISLGYEELLDYHKDGGTKNSVCVIHGGVISQLMINFFGHEDRIFSNWTPKAGRGYKLILEDYMPVYYERI